MIDSGGVLHLRLQAELWEARPVWDRLVYPAIVRMLRFTRSGAGRVVVIDSAAATGQYAAVPDPLPIQVQIGSRDRLAASARYYVHVVATVGTVADREIDDVNDAVFGRPGETNGLGSLERLLFRKMVEVSDYLQSVTAEARSKPARLVVP